jgi:hypothetical protein
LPLPASDATHTDRPRALNAGGGNNDRVAVDLRIRIDELLVDAGKLEPFEVSAFGSPRLP